MNYALWCQYAANTPRRDIGQPSYGIQNGHLGFANDNIWPILEALRTTEAEPITIIQHLPFGRFDTSTNMYLTTPIDARRKKLNYWFEDYIEATAEIVAAGHRVIAYLGSPHKDNRIQNASPKRRWLLITHALRYVIAAGAEPAFDNLSSDFGLTLALAKSLEQMGHKVWTEASGEFGTYQADMPTIIVRNTFLNRHVTIHPGAKGRFKNWADIPETIVLVKTGQEPISGKPAEQITQALTIAAYKNKLGINRS